MCSRSQSDHIRERRYAVRKRLRVDALCIFTVHRTFVGKKRLLMEIQEIDLNERYKSCLDAYKLALEKDINLKFTEFCRNNGVSNNAIRHWMDRRGLTVLSICKEVRKRLGIQINEPIEKYRGLNTHDLYTSIWKDFNEAIREDPSLTLTAFSKHCNVRIAPLERWLRRQNLSVFDAKLELAQERQNGADLVFMNETMRKRFRRILDQYMDILSYNPYLTVKEHCERTHTDLYQFQRWMRFNGISARMLKKSARMRARFAQADKQVQIQFIPNGHGPTDKLREVTVKLPDGSCFILDKCSVIDLCSFVVTYNQSVKPKKE